MKEGIIMPNYAKDGEVMYHTGLTKEMIKGAKYALVPGDPGRVEGLAKALDPNAAFVASHRDFTTWTAEVNGQPILVMSTGMGGPCVTFAVEELARLGVKTFIRVGTTGSMQEDLNLGDIVINKAAVRMDGASKAYAPIEYPAAADMRVTLTLEEAARTLKIPFKTGISVSTDSFWPGQERYDSYAATSAAPTREASKNTSTSLHQLRNGKRHPLHTLRRHGPSRRLRLRRSRQKNRQRDSRPARRLRRSRKKIPKDSQARIKNAHRTLSREDLRIEKINGTKKGPIEGLVVRLR